MARRSANTDKGQRQRGATSDGAGARANFKACGYRRLADENTAWGLLRALKGPLVLAFLDTAFVNETKIPTAEAHSVLDELLIT